MAQRKKDDPFYIKPGTHPYFNDEGFEINANYCMVDGGNKPSPLRKAFDQWRSATDGPTVEFVEWMGKIFRDSIESRKESGIGYGEQLIQAELYEDLARRLKRGEHRFRLTGKR